MDDHLDLLAGYGRLQGLVYRPGDQRFEAGTAVEAMRAVASDPGCLMVNRNQGSGTRILIDRLLGELRPTGYAIQSRSHHAVAAAVAQGRADWGVAIETVARQAGLGFASISEEQFDFAVPKTRMGRPAVQAFAKLLAAAETRAYLAALGFRGT